MFRKVVFGTLALVITGALVTSVPAALPVGGGPGHEKMSKSPPSSAKVDASAAALAQARARIQELERALAEARARIRDLDLGLEKAKVNAAELTQARARIQELEAQLAKAKASAAEVAQARAQLKDLESNLASERARAGQSVAALAAFVGKSTATPSPWAVLKIQFSDQNVTEWAPAQKYTDLFTSAGSSNLVAYYSDMTHGKLDLSGSQIFGPYTIPYKRSDYAGRWVQNPPSGQINSAGLWSLAKTTASNSGVNLNGYYGVCLTFIGQIDLFGGYLWDGSPGVFCDMNSLDVCGLAHEFGHAYGLAHSRIYGSTADYQDPWDIMSAYNVFNTLSQEFTTLGPGLNAWNMRGRGWLDESRVYTNAAASFDAVVELRPLHRRDLSGFLAAQVGNYLVEFRMPQSWDAGIPRACILVHSFFNNQSYLMYSYSGSRDIVEGDKFVFGDENFPSFGYYAVEVKKIDVPNFTATVALHQRPAKPIILPQAQRGEAPLPQMDPMTAGGDTGRDHRNHNSLQRKD
jgi:hypothetical protein